MLDLRLLKVGLGDDIIVWKNACTVLVLFSHEAAFVAD